MTQKYTLVLDDFIYFNYTCVCRIEHRVKLYRIRALIDFNDIKAGDLGGYVESYNNLSQKGNCWVYDNAKIYSHASVYHHAKIKNVAQVGGNAEVLNHSIISDSADVSGCVSIEGHARITENAVVTDLATVRDHALITGHARLAGRAVACDRAVISGSAHLIGLVYIGSDLIVNFVNDVITISIFDPFNSPADGKYSNEVTLSKNYVAVYPSFYGGSHIFKGTSAEFRAMAATEMNNHYMQAVTILDALAW